MEAPHCAIAEQRICRVARFGARRAGAPSPFFFALQAGIREFNWHEARNLAPSLHSPR